jgi:hypothetical protein
VRATRTSSGQGVNQSMVVQLMSAGKRRQRLRNASPTGLMQSTMCRLFWHWRTKVFQQFVLSAGTPSASQTGIMSEQIFAFSSSGYMPGTSPVLRMLFTSSSIDSTTICVSTSRKVTDLPSTPVISKSFLMSSRKATMS